ncbi:DNA-processing protein DprA [Novosphingobium taihuense]|uniref:DNA processing protein n=1 Tax=Novosphingobium taihuense TaxID=260085 RepID=A0A7W7EY06_9SPHN|nr:DNA-processing protein DprA [Novosphingobium taihuense]MBB4615890.1 DNA processing protein [Novosphingobium taihuense]TWH78565.1 DNA processing protein [Novosphingobium taihuense]
MLQTVSGSEMSKRPRYIGPAGASETTLLSILSQSGRDKLEAKQLSFLDKAAAKSGASDLKIFFAGNFELTRRRSIAIIGTRNVSLEGRKRASRFARELVSHDVVVVSGLAAGVDTQALTTAIREGGDVIAVIGTPINNAYPAENSQLQEEIYSHHLLISQFPNGTRTFPSNFPARNRTMAALTDASVIIEASETSGTLHQAAECVRLGRWLGLAKSVVEDRRLSWPSKFLEYEKCVVLESTEGFLEKIYGK